MTALTKEEIYLLIKNDLEQAGERNWQYELSAEQLESFTHELLAPIIRLVVKHPNTSSETLLKLVKSPEVQNVVKAMIPLNMNTPLEALQLLMPGRTNRLVASHPLCTPEMLTELAQHDDVNVREHVAGNANTPKKILSVLSEEANANVRYAVAGNPNTYQKDLNQLFKKSNLVVNGKHETPPKRDVRRGEVEVLEALSMREHNTELMWKRVCKALGNHHWHDCLCSRQSA